MNVFMTGPDEFFLRLKSSALPMAELRCPCPGFNTRNSGWKKMADKCRAWFRLNLKTLRDNTVPGGVIVTNTRGFLFYFPSVVLGRFFLGEKVVWRIRGRVSPLVKPLLYALSHLVVVQGNRSGKAFPSRGLWAWFWGPQKVQVLDTTIHVEAYRRAFGRYRREADPHFFKLCMVSDLVPGQGVMAALEVVKLLLDRGINVILVHARPQGGPVHGDHDPAHWERIQAFIRRHRLGRRVKFMDGTANLPEILGGSDVNILPGGRSGEFGAVTQASCLGLPTIAFAGN
ncbi:MAG: glycosyltransferase family 4 protein, partial [Desulfobacterales bacterium]|nr:glycosyltransferase family 4 protein [Desulfobacterales bacterium]